MTDEFRAEGREDWKLERKVVAVGDEFSLPKHAQGIDLDLAKEDNEVWYFVTYLVPV